MRNTTIKLFAILFASSFILFSSCKKDKNEKETDKEAKAACGESNFCFKLGNQRISFDTKWLNQQATNTIKIYYKKDLGGTSNERADLNIKTNGSVELGKYTFQDYDQNLKEAGYATFDYYKNLSGNMTTAKCKEGTLEITKFEKDRITGKFSCTGVDADGNAITITEGFINDIGR